jgi:phosphoribosyl-ATP pyrophosphohydrolase
MGKTLHKTRLVAKLKRLLRGDEEEEKGKEEEEGEEEEEEREDEDESVFSEEEEEETFHVTVPLYEKHVNVSLVAATLLERLPPTLYPQPRLIHLDIAYEVRAEAEFVSCSMTVM